MAQTTWDTGGAELINDHCIHISRQVDSKTKPIALDPQVDQKYCSIASMARREQPFCQLCLAFSRRPAMRWRIASPSGPRISFHAAFISSLIASSVPIISVPS